MPFVRTKVRRWSVTGGWLRPWTAGVATVVLLCGAYYFLATTGWGEVANEQEGSGRVPMNAGQRQLSDDVDELEKKFQKLEVAGDGGGGAAVATVLERAIERQKQLLQLNPRAGAEQNARLGRLEAARDTARARRAATQIAQLEKDANEERAGGRPDVALEKLQAAWRSQREVDNSKADAHYKNFVRETSLAQAIENAEAEPISREFETAMQQAHAAVTEQRWSDGLAAYGKARDAQARLNRDYAHTRYTNRPVLDEIEAEIGSLKAEGAAAEIDAREKGADAAAELGRAQEAAGLYRTACELQRSLNATFARSRFVSTSRIEEMEIKRQTVLAAEMLTTAAALDRAAAEGLRKRQVLAAERKIAEATALIERVETDFPKTRHFDGALKIKLAYLDLRRSDLRTLQDNFYDRLVPVPGTKNLLMSKTEIPQEFYAKVMNTNPSRNAGAALPVDSVNWNDAQEFCRRLTWLLGVQVRLPVEGEFRAALGAGDTAAWSAEGSTGRSQEAGKQPANEAGFCDLNGNLAEWLQPVSSEAAATTAPVAGGSYLDPALEVKKALITAIDRNTRARHIGFRVVVELALD